MPGPEGSAGAYRREISCAIVTTSEREYSLGTASVTEVGAAWMAAWAARGGASVRGVGLGTACGGVAGALLSAATNTLAGPTIVETGSADGSRVDVSGELVAEGKAAAVTAEGRAK
jgi:hypothetical protein